MATKQPSTSLMILLLAGALSSGALAADAADAPSKPQAQETIYGSQLMTPEERAAHRKTMRGMKTAEEREAFRAEHHRLMQERAKERGVTLPDTPPPRGMGMGAGGGLGMGRGMGPGGPNR